LTVREREVLDAFLAAGFPGAEALRRGIDGLRVTGMCGCGCPTIYLGHSEKGDGVDVIAEAIVRGTNDTILLFSSASGYLDSVEYVSVGNVAPNEFPTPDKIEVIQR
jgi:hypothetical protein